ncbi:MAG: DUF4159 domain-containing protein [Planctomycetaceae bacterium]|jgi:hypothetical protein|nr:DUF4159 domain-containing protein [Planctomycetaceae bacterium]
MEKFRFFFLVLLSWAAVLPAVGQDIDPKKVQKAMENGIAYLKKQQKPDGNWDEHAGGEKCGATALAVLALKSCGLPENDPAIEKGMQYLRLFPGKDAGRNYSLALQTMAFCAVTPVKDLPLIRKNVQLLEKNQVGTIGKEHNGGWHYTPGNSSDLSNSQFSILAFHEAERAGVSVSDAAWKSALRYWQETQNKSGAWGYTPMSGGGSSSPRGSMTCAGIASLIITASEMNRGGASVNGGKIVCLQKTDRKIADQIQAGVDWLAKNFSVTTNPQAGTYHLYYLYALERVGRMTNQRFIGQHDWYRTGTDKILAMQNDFNGNWHGNGGSPVSDTAFALLFLSKGRRPVLMSKIQLGSKDSWNVHPNDVNNITLFAEKEWKLDMTWQIIDAERAAADHLSQSPVLYFSGRNWAETDTDSLAVKLREYVDQGGFIIGEAQPDSKSFDTGFRTLMQKVFPEPGYELTLLEKNHPIWSAEKTIDPEYLRPLEGIQYGCRTCVVYIPNNAAPHSLSCLWEVARIYQRGTEHYPPAVQRQIDAGLGIGLNILAYATSRELKNKDEIPEQVVKKQTDADRRGRIFLPVLDYGAPNPAPHAPQNLLRYLESEFKMTVEHQQSSVLLPGHDRGGTNPPPNPLADYPVLFMHGRSAFTFTDEQRKTLRQHLERGGFLFANAICSAKGFQDSFTKEMKAVFPDLEFQKIPPSDPVFSDNYGGFKIETLDIRQTSRSPDKKTVTHTRPMQPELYGLRLTAEDRWMVIFSPYDVSCALEKASSIECRGYTQRSALQLSANIVLYAVEHW